MASVHDLTAYRAQAAGTGEPFHVAIIGAGVAGICQAIKLQEAGIAFTIFEKADDIGGTWRDNTYPGCSCDVPLHLYQYSFEMSPEWRNKFADHKQIKAYLDRVVEKYGLGPDIRLSTPVASAEPWDLTTVPLSPRNTPPLTRRGSIRIFSRFSEVSARREARRDRGV